MTAQLHTCILQQKLCVTVCVFNIVIVSLFIVPGQYLMVSGGDDSALYAAEFSFVVGNDNVIKIDVTREASRASAHTSSVTGRSPTISQN